MREKKYYELARDQSHKNRKKLIAQMKKCGFQEEAVLLVVDGLTGISPGGKEIAAKELTGMIANGADLKELTEWLERFRSPQYDYRFN